ncbi:MAG TPA: SpoIIE family protein phosphatase [bacterium]|nr:SpoIIE family protein phosphatase [bacterium]HQP96808.1 SpoIIE family protein phosphatase [bacterium]
MPDRILHSHIPNHERTILLVDDEQTNLQLLRTLLVAQGYQVILAENGREAIERIKEKTPDLLIMDVCMPEMSGLDACRIIKSEFREKLIQVILLTGLSSTESKVQGLDSGADDYLTKPYKNEEMLARIRSALRIHDLATSLYQTNIELQKVNSDLAMANRKIENDLKVVGDIQRSFLPQVFPRHPDLEFASFYEPSEQAGGDYYDVIEINKSRWGLLMADVTGHGTPAAVVMAITHLLMNSVVNTFRHPSTALKVINEKLNVHLAPTFYVTMFYGVLDLDGMRLTYSSAGHDIMLLYRARTGKVEELKTDHGFPLKLVESDEYDEQTVKFEPGDRIVLFTDGIVEMRNADGDLFGYDRLIDVICRNSRGSAQDLVDAIIRDLEVFCAQRPYKDDVTLLVLHRNP